MALGMTYDEFWHAEPERYLAYVEANNLNIKRRNEELWLQGLYIYHAFGVVMHNAFKAKSAKAQEYMKEPLPLIEKSEQEQEQEKIKAQEKMQQHLESLNADWQRRYGNKDKRT